MERLLKEGLSPLFNVIVLVRASPGFLGDWANLKTNPLRCHFFLDQSIVNFFS
jgi:hypothetical protein